MSAVAFEPATKHLLLVPEFFDGKPNRFVSVRVGVSTGVVIQVGTPLADIEWATALPDEVISSPVAGTVRSVNHNLSHGTLEDTPAQVLIILA
ncbi:MAG TPA: hypothetical protein VG734_23050 [Lacunisphaera sp.]|nr:hypothetical protein [Lacunisphaera sp.]